MLDCVLQFKGEAKRVNIKIIKYYSYILAHNGSDFDNYVVLNNLTQWRTVVNIINKESSIASLKKFRMSCRLKQKNSPLRSF